MAFDPLTPYVLKGVEVVSSEESKGQCGSYGFVYSVKVDGLLRIAKKPHSKILTQVSAAEKSRVLSNFKRECGLLSKLRHPNIVQFIGVYYERNSRDDMALVMEKLQFDLAQFVSSEPDIQLHMKLAILRDVTYGLVYLHEYNPPIIHRDLTARNILLTNSYQAKIADVGVSKLIDESARKASSYTQAPGQPNHMPPEALIKNPMYTSKLDIFSFGHVSLHTLVGDYPEVFEVLVTPAMAQEGTIQRMRRLISLDLIGSDHCLYPLITQCLMDNPDKRPTTREVNASVCLLAESHLKVTEDNMTDAVKLNIQQEVASLQQIIQPLQEENEKLRSELEALKIESDKLNKIKEKYFSLVSERADIFQKLNEAESQSKASDEQTVPLAGPDVEMSLVAADINVHRELGGLSMETLLQDKDMEIAELKAQLERALSRAMSKDGLDQVEMSLREEHVDLKKATETLNSRFTSVRQELTRVQSQNSDVSIQNEGLMRDITRLEEENLQLQSAVAKFKKMSEYWQKKCEDEDIEIKTAAQTVELTISLLQVDLNKLKKKLSRKENEVQTVKDCRKKLEEQLRIYQQERNRQDEQIAQLVAIKTNLTHALSRYDSYAHEVGEFKQQSQQLKKTLTMKISEVAHLKEEKLALQEEIKSVKEELDYRKAEVCGIQEDFQEERKDRARMASEIDYLKSKWKISSEELEEMKQQKEYWESQLNETREKWKMKQKVYETDIQALSDQVESLRTTEEKQILFIDQIHEESDAKLKATECRLLKERQDHEQTLKDLNRVTEKFQNTLQDHNRKLANLSTIQQELQDKIDVLSTDKSRLQEEKDELHVKLTQYEHEKMTSEKNLKQLCDYSEDLQQTVSRLEREKEISHGETENLKISFQEERQHLTLVQRNLELKLKETRKHYDIEKQQWINQLKSLDLLRKTMKSQLEEEKVVVVERSETINKYEQELLHLQERLQSMEYANAQRECDIVDLKRHIVRLEQENQQLHSKTMPSGDPSEDYHRLNQEKLKIEQQRVEYEKKYSILMDDYMKLRALAVQYKLKVPPRMVNPHDVQSFSPDMYNLSSSDNPIMGHPQYLAAEQGLSDVNHPGIRENKLIYDVNADIAEGVAIMKEKVVETSLVDKDDARPLDSNLICPLCAKQFRIGQIQHYRLHVGNCPNKPS